MSAALIFALLCVALVVCVGTVVLGLQIAATVKKKREEVQAKLDAPALAIQEAKDKREKARTHGRTEMLRNWAWWAAGEKPPVVPSASDAGAVNKLIDLAPPMDAKVGDLRLVLWQLSAATPEAKRIKRENELLDRYWSVAARVHFLTKGEGFDPARGIGNTEYLSNDDPGIREAYILGGKDAMDKIRTLVATARDRDRLYDSSMKSVAELAREHQAGLQALMDETGREDNAEAKWIADADRLGGVDLPVAELERNIP